jgi:hypothetical protein
VVTHAGSVTSGAGISYGVLRASDTAAAWFIARPDQGVSGDDVSYGSRDLGCGGTRAIQT